MLLQIINTSKEMMCYSDFPIPADYPMFMHNKYVQKYYHMYADHFDLKKYIKFNTEVHFGLYMLTLSLFDTFEAADF